MDKSGQHSVCTQLTLSLSNPFENITNSKVVMHCYHTDNKIQVQGSKVISRVSSAVWMVEHFIKPLVKQHVESNAGMINNINNEIISTANNQSEEENTNSVSNSACGRCKAPANPLAAYPRDQVLACRNCQKMFHKKCSDRRALKGNWRKEPWFCESCTLTYTPRNETETNVTPRTPLNPDAETFHPVGIESGPDSYPIQPSGNFLNTFQPTGTLHSDVSTHSRSNHPSGNPQTPKFPTTSTRQRSSNLNADNADLEFYKTAVNTCRSTITQQEVELKRLNESMDIRNKTIMQLEAKVRHATGLFASRDVADSELGDSNQGDLRKLLAKLDKLMEKLPGNNVPSTNIVINSCQTERTITKTNAVSTQADLFQYKCDECNNMSSNVKNHNESIHGKQQQIRRSTDTIQPSGTTGETSCTSDGISNTLHPGGTKSSLESNTPVPIPMYLCELCAEGFPSEENLSRHTESVHESSRELSPSMAVDDSPL